MCIAAAAAAQQAKAFVNMLPASSGVLTVPFGCCCTSQASLQQYSKALKDAKKVGRGRLAAAWLCVQLPSLPAETKTQKQQLL